MPSLPRKSKKPLGSHRRELPQTQQEPIPLHIEKHIERPPSYSQQPESTPSSRVIVIDLVGD